MVRSATIAGLIAVATTLAACNFRPGRPSPTNVVAQPDQVVAGDSGLPTSQIFAPAAMRIHPLTHLRRTEGGRVTLVVHVEITDTWGDVVKGAGMLSLWLARPRGIESPVADSELRWDINLIDAQRNAMFYDPATRTYRVELTELPAWVESMAPPPGEAGARRPAASVSLHAEFATLDWKGENQTLQHDYEIRG